MQQWRKAVYLILIAPLHYLLSLLAALPAMYLFPPDILAQLGLVLPLYLILVWWAVPAFQRLMGLSTSCGHRMSGRSCLVITAFMALALILVLVGTGFATPAEALVLAAVPLVCLHTLMLRTYLRTSR